MPRKKKGSNKSAPQPGAAAGQLVLFDARLRKRQKGDTWEMIVSGFEVQPVLLSSVVSEAAV